MVFVTGATGFLGSYLVKNLLNKGEQVRGLKRSTSNFDLLGDYANHMEWVEGDLLDLSSIENALDGTEKIYHCAAVVSSLSTIRERAKKTNIQGTANLFNTALEKKVKKVIHVSSVTAFGMPRQGQMIDENYYAPTSKLQYDYFLGKRISEMEAWRAHAEGLDLVIVNPSGFLGAGRWQHAPLNTFPAVFNGLSFYTGGSNGFVDVRDVAEAMVRLMESNISGERFILNSENFPLKDFLFLIADELKVKRPRYKVNGFIGELAWRYESIKASITRSTPDFTKDDIRIAHGNFNYSNSKIKKAIGFNFIPVAQSIRETATLFLESKANEKDFATFE